MSLIYIFDYKTQESVNDALDELRSANFITWEQFSNTLSTYDDFEIKTDADADSLIDFGMISYESDDTLQETINELYLNLTVDEIREHIGYMLYICNDGGYSTTDALVSRLEKLQSDLGRKNITPKEDE